MKIEYKAMYVNDVEKAKGFFVNYLDGKAKEMYHNTKSGFRSYFISFNDGVRLEIMNKPEMSDIEKPVNRTGYINIAFSVGSWEKVNELTDL